MSLVVLKAGNKTIKSNQQVSKLHRTTKMASYKTGLRQIWESGEISLPKRVITLTFGEQSVSVIDHLPSVDGSFCCLPMTKLPIFYPTRLYLVQASGVILRTYPL